MPHKSKEEELAWRRANYLKTREVVLARNKAWRAANPEKVKLGMKSWQKKNQEHIQQYREKTKGRRKETGAKWRAENAERFAEMKRAWNAANPDKVKAQQQRNRKRNADKIRDRNRKYQQANKDKTSVYRKRHYAKYPEGYHDRVMLRRGKIKEQGARLTRGLTQRLLVAQNYTCLICKGDMRVIGHSKDHIVALANGGLHRDDNIQLLCVSCNCMKQDLSMEEALAYYAASKHEKAAPLPERLPR